jgi:hypothetical protein
MLRISSNFWRRRLGRGSGPTHLVFPMMAIGAGRLARALVFGGSRGMDASEESVGPDRVNLSASSKPKGLRATSDLPA